MPDLETACLMITKDRSHKITRPLLIWQCVVCTLQDLHARYSRIRSCLKSAKHDFSVNKHGRQTGTGKDGCFSITFGRKHKRWWTRSFQGLQRRSDPTKSPLTHRRNQTRCFLQPSRQFAGFDQKEKMGGKNHPDYSATVQMQVSGINGFQWQTQDYSTTDVNEKLSLQPLTQ